MFHDKCYILYIALLKWTKPPYFSKEDSHFFPDKEKLGIKKY